jgi:hypothetical protein
MARFVIRWSSHAILKCADPSFPSWETQGLRGPLLQQGATEEAEANPAPLYLVFVPSVVLIFQITPAAPATEFSRNRAIAQSAELIGDIEEYRAAHGRYPSFLQAGKNNCCSLTSVF